MYPLFPFEPEEAIIEPHEIIRPVEMECAALFAMTQYRAYRFMPFLYGADNLDGESGWDVRGLCEQGVSRAEVYLTCALELCARLG